MPDVASRRRRDDRTMRTSTTTEPASTARHDVPSLRRGGSLARISGWCFDHRAKVVAAWLLVLAAILGGAGALGARFGSSSAVPGSDSAAGFAVLAKYFPELGTGGESGTIVFRARQGVENPEVRAAMEKLFVLINAGFPDGNGVPRHPGASVVSPYSEQGVGQIVRAGPLANQVAYAQVNLSADVDDTESGLIGDAIADHAPVIEGLEVLPGGQYLATVHPPRSELIGLAFAIVVLILAFGSVLAWAFRLPSRSPASARASARACCSAISSPSPTPPPSSGR
jgi:RND superfamily putative drug exporter